jgi:hypothetical protein
MHGDITPLPSTPSWRGAQLKHRDNFTFSFFIVRSRTNDMAEATLRCLQ